MCLECLKDQRACGYCRRGQHRDNYTAKQWKKGVDCSVCLNCLEGYGNPIPWENRRCAGCHVTLIRIDFQTSQWTKGDLARCKNCVNMKIFVRKSAYTNGHTASSNLVPDTSHEKDRLIMEKDRRLYAQDYLLTEKDRLIAEKDRMLMKAREESEASSLCIICCERKMDCIATPCGHFAYCLRCCTNLRDCCVCQQRAKFIKVFEIHR
jgi:hypothetical protein